MNYYKDSSYTHFYITNGCIIVYDIQIGGPRQISRVSTPLTHTDARTTEHFHELELAQEQAHKKCRQS